MLDALTKQATKQHSPSLIHHIPGRAGTPVQGGKFTHGSLHPPDLHTRYVILGPGMARVLIVKLGAIGDVIMAVPAAYQLYLAGHSVDWVCGPAVLPVLGFYPWIQPLAADEQRLLRGSTLQRGREFARLWRSLRRLSAGEPYDLVATLYYDRRYRLLTLPVHARRRLKLSPQDRAHRLLPGRHHTDELARILLGRPDEVTPLSLPPVPVQREALPESPLPSSRLPRVVLVPAGARNLLADDALRRWPAENYVRLADMLLERGFEVVLAGGPGDEWVQPLFASLAVVDRIGQLALPETLALLDSADVTVTHDTGPLHLAGLTRTGIIALFGPTNPREKLPQRPGAVALWGGEGFACRPCYDGRSFAPCPANDCLRQLSPEHVFEEVLSMLQDRADGILVAPQVRVPPSTIAPEALVPLAERRA